LQTLLLTRLAQIVSIVDSTGVGLRLDMVGHDRLKLLMLGRMTLG
jgi:hypothetical protein